MAALHQSLHRELLAQWGGQFSIDNRTADHNGARSVCNGVYLFPDSVNVRLRLLFCDIADFETSPSLTAHNGYIPPNFGGVGGWRAVSILKFGQKPSAACRISQQIVGDSLDIIVAGCRDAGRRLSDDLNFLHHRWAFAYGSGQFDWFRFGLLCLGLTLAHATNNILNAEMTTLEGSIKTTPSNSIRHPTCRGRLISPLKLGGGLCGPPYRL